MLVLSDDSPSEVLAILVHRHLGALELVELAADRGLVARGEPRPWLVRATVVVVRLGTRHYVCTGTIVVQITKTL